MGGKEKSSNDQKLDVAYGARVRSAGRQPTHLSDKNRFSIARKQLQSSGGRRSTLSGG